MLSRIFLCTICSLIAVAPALAKEKTKPATPSESVACAGVYGASSSEDLLIETFGQDNVVTGLVDGPEGSQYLATTVYKGDPGREMIFSWFDEDKREALGSVQLSPSQIGPGGIRIGMTVAEVVAVNGAPFTLGGFWWDYGGYAGFDSGNLSGVAGDCYVNLRFAPSGEVSDAIDTSPISGDVQVASGEALLEMLDVRVEQLSLGYANADYAE